MTEACNGDCNDEDCHTDNTKFAKLITAQQPKKG